jgi:hypothetical protein
MGLVNAIIKPLLLTLPFNFNYRPSTPAPPQNDNCTINLSLPVPLLQAASSYSNAFEGHTTANGQIFHQKNFTIASRTLPFGTVFRITSLTTGKNVIATVTDRGPYSHFDIDVSTAVFLALGLHLTKGWDWVTVEVVPKKD